MKELIDRYLTGDKNHFKKMNRENMLDSKEKLYYLLKWWLKLSNKNTIGNTDNTNNNQQLILIELGANRYYINADTNKAGVKEFLKNKNEPWRLIENRNGNLNKITNSDSDIPGFYMYQVIN